MTKATGFLMICWGIICFVAGLVMMVSKVDVDPFVPPLYFVVAYLLFSGGIRRINERIK